MGDVVNTKQAADMLGISVEKFRLWRQQPDCPIKSLPYCKGKYYVPAIKLYLDRVSGVNQQSGSWNDAIMKGLAGGGDSGAILRH